MKFKYLNDCKWENVLWEVLISMKTVIIIFWLNNNKKQQDPLWINIYFARHCAESCVYICKLIFIVTNEVDTQYFHFTKVIEGQQK